MPRTRRQRRVEDLLDLVGLAPAERDRRPAGLSGGQQQRVALARALAVEPALLLLDEPLSSLDRRLREQLRGELAQLQRRTGVTTLLVTHDQEEALGLADRVGILARGRLVQTGTPRELYERPGCPFVASFLGEANLLVIGGDPVMVRPAGVLIDAGTPLGEGTVIGSTFRGEQVLLRIEVAGTTLLAACRPAVAPPVGASVRVGVDPAALWLLPGPDPAWLRAT